MDLDATPYRYFVAIAEHRSFTRAANALAVSQPALSAQIKELERRIGFELLDRTTRRVSLTAEGRLFLPNARRMILETSWIRRAAEEIRTNQLLIGCAPYLNWVPERFALIERFMVDHHEMPLRILTMTQARLYREMNDQNIDLALAIEPELSDMEGSAAEPSASNMFERMVLESRRLRLLVPVEHRLAACAIIDPRELRGEKIAVLSRSHGIALTEIIARKLIDVGAQTVRPPEGTSLALERYVRLMRIPCVAPGWFQHPPFAEQGAPVVERTLGIEISSGLVLIRSTREPRPAASLFWDAAERWRAAGAAGSTAAQNRV